MATNGQYASPQTFSSEFPVTILSADAYLRVLVRTLQQCCKNMIVGSYPFLQTADGHATCQANIINYDVIPSGE